MGVAPAFPRCAFRAALHTIHAFTLHCFPKLYDALTEPFSLISSQMSLDQTGTSLAHLHAPDYLWLLMVALVEPPRTDRSYQIALLIYFGTPMKVRTSRGSQFPPIPSRRDLGDCQIRSNSLDSFPKTASARVDSSIWAPFFSLTSWRNWSSKMASVRNVKPWRTD